MLGAGLVADGELPLRGVDVRGGAGGEHGPVLDQRLPGWKARVGLTLASGETTGDEGHDAPGDPHVVLGDDLDVLAGTLALGMPTVRGAAPSTAGRPDTDLLVDTFGRVARDLRVSITSACSLRCTYCMPAEGLPVIPTRDLLSADEIGRLVGIAVHDLGVREIRFTGGEPLTRPDLVDIIQASSSIAPGIPLAMTTNGLGLDRKAAALAEAGLTRINVSLDTVDREHFAAVTRRDRLPAVLPASTRRAPAGLGPIKVNAVAMRETLPMPEICWPGPSRTPCGCGSSSRCRSMPTRPGDATTSSRLPNCSAVLGTRFALTPVGRPDDPSSPAEEWLVDGAPRRSGSSRR